jgi:hypothetical protein
MADLTDPYWEIAKLVERVRNHDWNVEEWKILIIVTALAKDGRVRAIGRRCDNAGQPRDEWEQIPAHEWADLSIVPRGRLQPYSGDVIWSSGRRAWLAVQFSERDLMREWLTKLFAQPKLEPPADIIIPPRRSEDPSTSGSAPSAIGNTPASTVPTPKEFVDEYIAGRLAARQEYSGRGAQRERDRRKLNGKPGFGKMALNNLVARERTRRGKLQNLGGRGSAG